MQALNVVAGGPYFTPARLHEFAAVAAVQHKAQQEKLGDVWEPVVHGNECRNWLADVFKMGLAELGFEAKGWGVKENKLRQANILGKTVICVLTTPGQDNNPDTFIGQYYTLPQLTNGKWFNCNSLTPNPPAWQLDIGQAQLRLLIATNKGSFVYLLDAISTFELPPSHPASDHWAPEEDRLEEENELEEGKEEGIQTEPVKRCV